MTFAELTLLCMEAGIDLAAAVRETFNSTSETNGLQTRMEAPR